MTIWEISAFNLQNLVGTASGRTEVWKRHCLTSASSAQVSKAAPPWQPAPPGAGQGTRMDATLSTGDPQRHKSGVGAGSRTGAGSGSRRCRAAKCRRELTSLQHQLQAKKTAQEVSEGCCNPGVLQITFNNLFSEILEDVGIKQATLCPQTPPRPLNGAIPFCKERWFLCVERNKNTLRLRK